MRIAANVLTKAAIDRGSKDNVTVVIVDLRASSGERGGPVANAATTGDGEPPSSSPTAKAAAAAKEMPWQKRAQAMQQAGNHDVTCAETAEQEVQKPTTAANTGFSSFSAFSFEAAAAEKDESRNLASHALSGLRSGFLDENL